LCIQFIISIYLRQHENGKSAEYPETKHFFLSTYFAQTFPSNVGEFTRKKAGGVTVTSNLGNTETQICRK
jgi:hypothetical protein